MGEGGGGKNPVLAPIVTQQNTLGHCFWGSLYEKKQGSDFWVVI